MYLDSKLYLKPKVILKGSDQWDWRVVRREANVRCWSGTVVMEFVLFFIWQTSSKEHISVSATPAKLIGNDQTISNSVANFKGIDRPFGEGVKSRLILSLLLNWRLGNFFSSPFKWISSQDQQKTNRPRLIIYKVTLTGQSHFMRIFLTP